MTHRKKSNRKIMNRESMICGTTSRDLLYVKLKPLKCKQERDKKYIQRNSRNFPKFGEKYKPIGPTISMKLKHKKLKENYIKIHHNQVA